MLEPKGKVLSPGELEVMLINLAWRDDEDPYQGEPDYV